MIGYWWLVPNDYDQLAESAIAHITLVSNIYFANSFNYFAGPAELVPLLHTLLLALEEQFYLLFPLPLIFCRHCSPKNYLDSSSFPHSSLFWFELVDHGHLSDKSIFPITNASLLELLLDSCSFLRPNQNHPEDR